MASVGEARPKREVPTWSTGTILYSGSISGDPVSGHDHDLTVCASFSENDGFELAVHDDGHWPVDELHQALWVEPEDVPLLVRALGGGDEDDPVRLMAEGIANGSIRVKTAIPIERVAIFDWFKEKGVPYTSDSRFVSNS
ncbi:hypothetical protein [Mycolicibacterium vanbaalenii]|uniref:Uncharacterized protein n=1 Tax=Mycolicibacterium vanbaalenii (strain DSM 7251 / JCM 13017 / BCRC 16820 / KCTC 9966 / NRRL B-24157 / PYR-1) TaxID=350058 RepID=A1T439_MYCVP|nr:hypothetical protein [Mycolicibacterium vanbaalenii]ABM11939.1 hypothetical protein Mvan_1102 [Mycolicibacterium vanbaalenii PYR-1]MCV7130025.1 hypothetical protein [Mycolicibacterium vanbaalenii PYR-1]